MVDADVSDKILTLSGPYNPPNGGIGQVVFLYSEYVFSPFHFLSRGRGHNKIQSFCNIIKTILYLHFYLLLHRNIRIIHIHTASGKPFAFSTFYAKISKLHKRKVVMHIHGGAFAKCYYDDPVKVKKQLAINDAVIALTKSWQVFFKETVGCENVYVVNNIVEPAVFNGKKTDDTKTHFLFLGKICEKKGIFDLIETMGKHKGELQDRMILHIGGSGETDKLEQMINEYDISDLVLMEGWVSGEKKKALLNIMDVLILPSYVEGLPISILESFSYGKTVITTPVGGIPEIVNNHNGLLFSPGNQDELYSCIHYVLENPSNVERLGKEGKRNIDNNLPDFVAKQLNDIYKKLLNE